MDNSQKPLEPVSQGTFKPAAIRRPASVTLLTLGVLIITGLNLTRFVLSLRYWSFLTSQPGISQLYLALSGLVWTIAGAVLVWGLWQASGWAPRLMQAVALTYALYYWLDLLFLRDHPLRGATPVISVVLPTNWQFSAGVTLVCLAFMEWTLRRHNVKNYFSLDQE